MLCLNILFNYNQYLNLSPLCWQPDQPAAGGELLQVHQQGEDLRHLRRGQRLLDRHLRAARPHPGRAVIDVTIFCETPLIVLRQAADGAESFTIPITDIRHPPREGFHKHFKCRKDFVTFWKVANKRTCQYIPAIIMFPIFSVAVILPTMTLSCWCWRNLSLTVTKVHFVHRTIALKV